jgi:hypothetical protein
MQDELVTVVKIPYLIRPDKREYKQLTCLPGMTVRDALGSYVEDLEKLGFSRLVVSKNGYLVSDWDEVILPGDFVGVSVEHGFQAGAIAAWLVAIGAAATVASAATAAAIIAAVLNAIIMMGVGLLIQTLMPKPSVDAASTANNDPASSPTYGMQAVNPVQAGGPVPVVYGNVRTSPTIIGSYRRVATDYNVWVYLLMAMTQGETSDYPGPYDIFIGDEPLVNFTNYYYRYTTGAAALTGTDIASLSDKFSSIWHDRPFDRILKYVAPPVAVPARGQILLTSNPLGGETITIGGETWTFVGAYSDPPDPFEIEIQSTVGYTAVEAAARISASSSWVSASSTEEPDPNPGGGYGDGDVFGADGGGSGG